MKKINVGISGFGLSGRYFHYPFFTSNGRFQVKAIQTSQVDLAKSLNGDIAVVREFEQLCSQPIDLICLSTPNHLHFEGASRALQSGKNVLVEKPFTVTVAEAANLTKLAKKHNRVLTVFHNRRYDSDFLTLKDLLQRKILGEIVEFEAHFDRFRVEAGNRWKEQPNPGSGVLYDLGSHLIDQALCLFGTPKRILADLEVQRQGASEKDYFFLMFDYGRLKLRLRAGCLVAAPGPRYKVHGTEGSFFKSGLDPQESQLRSGSSPLDPSFGRESPEIYGFVVAPPQSEPKTVPSKVGCYMQFFNQLADAIECGSPPPVLPEDATKVIRCIEICQQSFTEQRWVEWSNSKS